MEDILIKIFVCFIAGAGAGLGTGFAGMSAAAVIGPMLITFLGVPAYDAVGIGLISDVLASLVSAYTYKKSGNLDIKNSLPLLVSVLVVTMIGSFVASFLPEQAMSGAMQIALIIIGLRFLLKPINKTREQLEESSPKSRLIKAIVGGIFVGFMIDFILRLIKRPAKEINIDEICDNDNCHCERGILPSAIHHTVTIFAFVFLCTVAINAAVYFIGDEVLASMLYNKPVIGHFIAAIFGLIPNCAASVALTTFAKEGFITVGTMLSGLFSGSGVGLLVLFKMNKHIKENLIIVGILVLSGVIFGLIADAIPILTI